MTLGVKPLSEVWGSDRGVPIHRHYLEAFLAQHQADIRGRVLEFQDDGYTVRFGGGRVTRSDILHIDASNPRATLVADLTQPHTLPEQAFDCIVCTHVMHIVYDLRRFVSEVHRLLAPGGVLLVGVPMVSMCDGGWHELWRFTPEGLRRLLQEAFGEEAVRVHGFGNALVAAGELRGVVASEFSPRELATQDERFAVEVCGRAVRRS
jgi:SAM-dependent methyltransferase